MFTKMFCKYLYVKCGIIFLKNNILHNKIQKQQSQLSNEKFRIFRTRNIFKNFIASVKTHAKFNKIIKKNQNFKIKQYYLNFFKNIAIRIQERAVLKHKKVQLYQNHLIYIVKKSIKIWNNYVKIKNEKLSYKLRRMIIGRIFLNNLREYSYEQRAIGENYRFILLRKYYFHRLRRATHYSINMRIAKIKFISKFIFLWKGIVKMNKIDRQTGVISLINILEKLIKKSKIKNKQYALDKLKKRYMNLIINEINNNKINNFQNYQKFKSRKFAFNLIKYNYWICLVRRKKLFIMKKKVFNLIKLNKNNCTKPLIIKKNEADKFYINHMKKLILKCIINWRYISNDTLMKLYYFQNKIYKKKIFRYLKAFRIVNKTRDLKISIKFRTYFLYYHFFQILKKNSKIMKREKNIVNGVKNMITEKELEYKDWAFESLYYNALVEKYKKQKELRLKTKIFYLLKMLSGC